MALEGEGDAVDPEQLEHAETYRNQAVNTLLEALSIALGQVGLHGGLLEAWGLAWGLALGLTPYCSIFSLFFSCWQTLTDL